MNFAGDALPQRGGLLGAVQKSLNSNLAPMGICYGNHVSQIQNLRLHLGCWSGTRGFAFRSGFEIRSDLRTELERAGLIDNRWYWLSYINQLDLTGEYVESYSFWDASQQWRIGIVLKDFLYCVIARKSDGTLHRTFRGEHVA